MLLAFEKGESSAQGARKGLRNKKLNQQFRWEIFLNGDPKGFNPNLQRWKGP